MTSSLLLLAVSGFILIASLLVVRWVERERLRRRLVAYRLRFPRAVEPDAVVALFSGLAGILAPRLLRYFLSRPLVFEVSATTAGIEHHLLVPEEQRGVVLSQMRAALPDVEVREDPEYELPPLSLAGELGLNNHRRSLRVDHPESVAAALLASLQPVGPGETVVMQWILTPVGPVPAISGMTTSKRNGAEILIEGLATSLRDAESVRAARVKQASALFRATCRLGVVAEPNEARLLLRRLTAPFHIVNAPGVHLRRRSLPSWFSARALWNRTAPLIVWPLTLNATELTALTAVPLGQLHLPGLQVGGVRQLPPSPAVPSEGRIIALASFPGAERPLALSVRDSLLHTWVCGPTGVGKSTLLANLIVQDMVAGRSVVLIDPKGDLVADVLDRVPTSRVVDVILIDPADLDFPVGINPLAGAHLNPELVADQVLAIFHRIFRAYWGPRTQDILHAALLTLAQEPGSTLVDVPLLLTNSAFRRRLVGRLDDPIALEPFWAAYEAMSPGELAQAIGPVMNKLRQFLLRPRLRAMLGQAEPTFTIEEILKDGRILLVSLPGGVIGDEASALVGSLLVARLWQAIQSRAALPADRRKAAFVYLDEFHQFTQGATDLGNVLAQARGLGVGFTLAHQHLGQLSPDLRQAITANARSKVVFQQAPGDAVGMARELGPIITPTDLTNLGAYEIIAALAAGGQAVAPATGRTLPLPPGTGAAQAVRAASRGSYGRPRAEVDAAVRGRQEAPLPDGPTLRRKRGGS